MKKLKLTKRDKFYGKKTPHATSLVIDNYILLQKLKKLLKIGKEEF